MKYIQGDECDQYLKYWFQLSYVKTYWTGSFKCWQCVVYLVMLQEICFLLEAFISLSPLWQCIKISKAMVKSDSRVLTPKATSFKMKIFKIRRLKTGDKLLDGQPRHREAHAPTKPSSVPSALLSPRGSGAGWRTHWQGSHQCPPHSPCHWSLADIRTCSCPGCYGRDRGSCRA